MESGDTVFYDYIKYFPSALIPYFCSVPVVAVGHSIPCGCILSKTSETMISKNAEKLICGDLNSFKVKTLGLMAWVLVVFSNYVFSF